MSSIETRRAIWSRYWQEGILHCLPGSYAGNYGGVFRDFWLGVFRDLRPSDSVLDIGTGNGALPALIVESLRENTPVIDAIDLATMAPSWLSELPASQTIRFHGNTAVESLPFEDHAFDLVISQYGLEYAGHEEATREATRVLKPRGRLALLMHHAQSHLVQVAREEITIAKWLLRSGGLMECALDIYPYVAEVRASGGSGLAANARASDVRSRINQLMGEASAMAASSPVPDSLHESQDFVSGQIQSILRTGNVPSALAKHARYCRGLRDSLFRNEELCKHAVDDAAMSSISMLFGEAGIKEIDFAPLASEGLLLGWKLCGCK